MVQSSLQTIFTAQWSSPQVQSSLQISEYPEILYTPSFKAPLKANGSG